MKPAALAIVLTFTACNRQASQQPRVSEVVLATHANSPRVLRGIVAGDGPWRYTEPGFAFSLDAPAPNKPTYVEMDYYVPSELSAVSPTVMVVAKVNGVEAARKTVTGEGRQTLAGRVPAEALRRQPATVEFSADQSFQDGGKARSLIVFSAALREYEQTSAFREAELAKAQAGYSEVLKQRNLQMPLEKQREIMRLFHDLPIWNNVWFQNVRVIKNPLDLWMLQQIAYEVQPDFILETGTWRGGSALWWAHTLSGMGLDRTRVLTVDLQNLTGEAAASHPLWKKHVEFFQGSSTDAEIVSRFAERVKGRKTIVNLDSDHSMQHVLNELRLYAPLVSPGSYIAVEDTHLDGVPTHPEEGPGPSAAIRRFLSEPAGKDFEQDFAREAFVMTSYPGGWLRRKK